MEYLAAGAASTVTGSCHHFTFDDRRIVVDCGMFQGPEPIDRLNHEPFPFEPGAIDALVLTHGHLDHVGRLPKLVKEGFGGPIFATSATRSIAEIILRDSAKIQAEEFERSQQKTERGTRGRGVRPPLYDLEDVERTLQQFEPVAFGSPWDEGGVRIRLGEAGHILGSAWVSLETPDVRLVVSGDIGNRESTLQRDAELPPACDVVLVETTYADRRHRSMASTQREFRRVLQRALQRGGNVLIPSFALERTQQILFELNRIFIDDEPAFRGTQVFLDSPMAGAMTDLYRREANEFRDEVATMLAAGKQPFTPPNLTFTRTSQESRKINDIEGGAVIIAGSGMMTGGRIVHHLKHNLWNPAASLVVVGYQAHGTLGRRIVEGASNVRLLGDRIQIRASIHTINGFSAHADRDDLLDWLEPTEDAHVVMVHGERDVMDAFNAELTTLGRAASAPVLGDTLTF